eukprot:1159868-Pelagomonas_calceolata.AAC.4
MLHATRCGQGAAVLEKHSLVTPVCAETSLRWVQQLSGCHDIGTHIKACKSITILIRNSSENSQEGCSSWARLAGQVSSQDCPSMKVSSPGKLNHRQGRHSSVSAL